MYVLVECGTLCSGVCSWINILSSLRIRNSISYLFIRICILGLNTTVVKYAHSTSVSSELLSFCVGTLRPPFAWLYLLNYEYFRYARVKLHSAVCLV